ncbi:MAG TPA: L-2-hydroxyglutarate oxidase [Gemmatimonadaceae bacterium]|nr:L-2-hydroxyglutarate oxidase [Gemmatimonadaceae bacterium]
MTADILVVGGGIVGLATAHAVQRRFPGHRVLLLEKEQQLALHQTGRNSGVIHSGIYYKPGSFKARFCKAGNASMQRFCAEHGIPFERPGKVIVATEPAELPELDKLRRRGIENGIEVRPLDPAEMRELEPHLSGIAALHVPSTGITDYGAVAAKLAELVVAEGGEIRCGVRVLRATRGVVETTAGEFEVRQLINCGGLHSDRLARASGAKVDAHIVPFRGEYYQLRAERRSLVRGLIYPVPNPLFPFLGVHCTRMIDGSVHLGPNAVLAFAREGYRKRTVNLRDLTETLAFPGFWKLAARHWRDGWQEIVRSFSRAAFVRSLQRLVPEITEDDVVPCEAGVRAQALRPDGTLEDDFLIVRDANAIHVCNAPSPAATASLEIGATIAAMLAIPALEDTLTRRVPAALLSTRS